MMSLVLTSTSTNTTTIETADAPRVMLVSLEGFTANAARHWVECVNESVWRLQKREWTVVELKCVGKTIRLSLAERPFVGIVR